MKIYQVASLDANGDLKVSEFQATDSKDANTQFRETVSQTDRIIGLRPKKTNMSRRK